MYARSLYPTTLYHQNSIEALHIIHIMFMYTRIVYNTVVESTRIWWYWWYRWYRYIQGVQYQQFRDSILYHCLCHCTTIGRPDTK
jgi:hypothetical protein